MATTGSYGQIIQKVWSPVFEKRKRKTHVIANLTNQSFSGDVKDGGETVKIVEEALVTKNSSLGLGGGPISYQDLAPSSQELKIAYDPYINIRLDERQRDQIKQGDAKKVISYAIDYGMYLLRDDVDTKLAGLYTDAGLTYTTNAVTITSSNAFQYLKYMRTIFKKANLGAYEQDWCAVLPPEWLERLELDTSNIYTIPGFEQRVNGWKGRCNGWQIFESNNLTTDANGYTWPLFLIRGQSLALAMQKEPTFKDTTRPNYYEEAYAYRIVYGCKGYRPDKFGTLPVVFG